MVRKVYFQEHIDYLRKITPGRRDTEICRLFNEHFKMNVTLCAIKTLRQRHGIKLTLPRMERKYTDEQIDYLRELSERGLFNREITKKFNKRFGTEKTQEAIAGQRSQYGFKTSARYRFLKGHKPWNTGCKGVSYPGMRATQFRPGNIPPNWLPVGSKRVNCGGYIQIKVQDGKNQQNWKSKHIIVWERHHGRRVPLGHVVIFGDGNRRNLDPDNLILVSRAQLAILNKNRLIQNDADLTRTGLKIVDVLQKVAEVRRGRGEE